MLDHSPSEHNVDNVGDAKGERVWHFQQPGDSSPDGWDPTPLNLACETIAHDRRRKMTRIHSVFKCPEIPGGANEVMDYAQSLADDYGLSMHCAVSHGMVTVTFERAEGHH